MRPIHSPATASGVSARTRFAVALVVPRAVAFSGSDRLGEEDGVFAESEDDEQIIERVAGLDIGKVEVVCCVRCPHQRARNDGSRR